MAKFLALIGLIGVVVGVVAAGYFFGGFYSVAATVDDPAPVKWALIRVRQASIDRQATETPPGSLETPAQIQAGARAYATRGCTNCHGGPGVEWAKWSEGLRPDPPDLKEVVNDRTPAQLFWVIKNGINMTGMPSFALAGAKDEDIWSIVAFLKKLPVVSEADYKAWTAPSPPPVPAPAASPPPAAAPVPDASVPPAAK